jgi:hypothetical protein
VPASFLARAIVVAIAVGLAGGLVLGLIVRPLVFGGFLYLAAFAGFGYLMSEAIGLATGRKQGPRLQFVAGAGVVIAGLVSLVLSVVLVGGSPLFDVLGSGLAVYVAVIRLR